MKDEVDVIMEAMHGYRSAESAQIRGSEDAAFTSLLTSSSSPSSSSPTEASDGPGGMPSREAEADGSDKVDEETEDKREMSRSQIEEGEYMKMKEYEFVKTLGEEAGGCHILQEDEVSFGLRWIFDLRNGTAKISA